MIIYNKMPKNFLTQCSSYAKYKTNIEDTIISILSSALKKKENLLLPDFLGIGAQKSGSTWLSKMLQLNHSIFIPDRKEIHFFDNKFYKGKEWYSYFFKNGEDKIKGEITPGYSILSVKRIRAIKTLIPQVKLIIILRNPVERAWSHAIMDLIRLSNRKYNELNDTEFYNHFNSEGSRKRGNYIEILNNWYKVFPRERILIKFFEDINDNPVELIRSVSNHIGVDQEYNIDNLYLRKRFNKNPTINIPLKFREYLELLYHDQIEKLYKMLNNPIVLKWLDGEKKLQ